MVLVSWQVWTGRCNSRAFMGLCFPLLLALVCVCVCVRAWWVVMERERTSARGHGCGQSVEEDLGSKLVKIACDAGLLEG